VGADPKLAGSANGYFQLYAVSIAPMILSAVTSAVFRSLNAPRTPLIITSAAVALNTVLGFVLVLGFGPLWQQKGRTLGLATARFKGRHHSGQAPALDRADRAFRGALGHDHVHLRSSVHTRA
jgi:Na+-driven multidrug efflux pump